MSTKPRLSVIILHYEIDESDNARLKATIDSFLGHYDELIIADKKTDFVTKKINDAIKKCTGDYIIITGNDNKLIAGSPYDLCKEGVVKTAKVNPHQDVVLMTLTCIPRTVLNEVGLFDEGFKCYCADEDFLLRLRAKGIPIECDNNVVVEHNVGGRTTGRLPGYKEIDQQDKETFKKKWNIQ